MLGKLRGPQPDAGASYSVAWANLRKRYPRARRILLTGASSRDDPSLAAVGLAEAAGRLDRSSVLVMVLDSAKHDRLALDSPVSSVRIIDAATPTQVRAALSSAGDELGFSIIVAPAPQKGSDCISLAYAADVAILVARSGRTRFGEAQLAAKLLRQAGVPTAAAVLLTRRTLRSRKSIEAGTTRVLGHSQGIAEN